MCPLPEQMKKEVKTHPLSKEERDKIYESPPEIPMFEEAVLKAKLAKERHEEEKRKKRSLLDSESFISPLM